jgi:hypothetical protein
VNADIATAADIEGSKILANSIDSTRYADDSITYDKIKSNSGDLTTIEGVTIRASNVSTAGNLALSTTDTGGYTDLSAPQVTGIEKPLNERVDVFWTFSAVARPASWSANVAAGTGQGFVPEYENFALSWRALITDGSTTVTSRVFVTHWMSWDNNEAATDGSSASSLSGPFTLSGMLSWTLNPAVTLSLKMQYYYNKAGVRGSQPVNYVLNPTITWDGLSTGSGAGVESCSEITGLFVYR